MNIEIFLAVLMPVTAFAGLAYVEGRRQRARDRAHAKKWADIDRYDRLWEQVNMGCPLSAEQRQWADAYQKQAENLGLDPIPEVRDPSHE